MEASLSVKEIQIILKKIGEKEAVEYINEIVSMYS